MKLSLWDRLLVGDGETAWIEGRRAQQELNQQEVSIAELRMQMTQTSERAARVSAENDQLRCMVSALAQLLVEKHVVEESALKAAFARAADELERARPRAPARNPDGSDADPPRADPVVACNGCGKRLPSSQTNVGESGVYCDACFSRLSAGGA